MLTSAMGYLAAAEATQMPAEVQAQCLIALERADAMGTAARASILAAFTAAQGYCEDGGLQSPVLADPPDPGDQGHRGRAQRLVPPGQDPPPDHGRAGRRGPRTKSYARTICAWTDKLPEDCRDSADAILVSAAQMGMELPDLAALAAEIEARSRPDVPDEDGPRFEDRAVKLETTFGGAGVMTGDLTPECAAVVTAVLDALSAPRGAEDDRSHGQRYHDALEEAMRRLVAAGLLPERAGQPVRVTAHIDLTDLIDLDVGSKLQKEWTEGVRGRWAAARAAASAAGSDGAAWLEGEAAEGFACDASMTPVVFGTVNPGVMEELVRFCVQLAGHGPGRCTPHAGPTRRTTPPRTAPPGPHRLGPHRPDQAARVSRCRVPSRCRPA